MFVNCRCTSRLFTAWTMRSGHIVIMNTFESTSREIWMQWLEKRLQMLNDIKSHLHQQDLSWSNIVASVLSNNQLVELNALTNIILSLGLKKEVIPLLIAQYHLHVEQEQDAESQRIKNDLGDVLWEVGQYSHGGRIL